MTSAMMDELAAVKAIANKAWGSQTGSEERKIRRFSKRKWKVQRSAEEEFWTLLWMCGNWTFHQRVLQPPQEVFKLKRGEPGPKTPPAQKRTQQLPTEGHNQVEDTTQGDGQEQD